MKTKKHAQWMRTAALLSALILTVTLTACKKEAAQPPKTPEPAPTEQTTPGQTTPPGQTPPQPGQSGQTPPGQTGQGGETAKPPEEAPIKIGQLQYTEIERTSVATAAKNAGVPTYYLPERGASDDKIDQMATSAKLLTLKYYKMTILESPEEIKPSGKVESKQEVKLRNGTGQWVTVDGKKTLYLKLDKTYIALSSDKLSEADLQTVAESLATLK